MGISMTKGSSVLTLLSLFEAVSYAVALVIGDRLRNRLIFVNMLATFFLALNFLLWPVADINFETIVVLAMGSL